MTDEERLVAKMEEYADKFGEDFPLMHFRGIGDARIIKAIDEYIGALDDIRALAAYYAGETWMKDFAADEAGKLPAEL